MPECADSRLAWLEAAQNSDGGWGYFRGKRSWLEPTAFALLALSADSRRASAFERGWALVRSWQLPDGGWRPCAQVNRAHWTTALAVTLHARLAKQAGPDGEAALDRGIAWLVRTTGAENRPWRRLAHWLKPRVVEFDPKLSGWPWQPGDSSWIEPTAHTLMALKCAARGDREAARRIEFGERLLLDRRCADGGWNYGNRRVLRRDLPSYPETTALALLALAGNRSLDWNHALAQAERSWRETSSPLARAWLAVCLARYGRVLPGAFAENTTGDILVCAVEAMACSRILG